MKPDVVLYEECLDTATMNGAVEAIQKADLLMVGGTSLAVYPAVSLLQYYPGKRLVLINKTPTPYDRRADLVLSGPIGEDPGADRSESMNRKLRTIPGLSCYPLIYRKTINKH